MRQSNIKKNKALEILVYVAQECSDLYTALKVVYFADKMHLARYGHLMFGESYIAMKDGPVPSYAYDVLKAVDFSGAHSSSWETPTEKMVAALELSGWKLTTKRAPNLDLISESERECLDESLAENKDLSFDALKRKAHQQPDYEAVGPDDEISLKAIVDSLPEREALWEYLNQD